MNVCSFLILEKVSSNELIVLFSFSTPVFFGDNSQCLIYPNHACPCKFSLANCRRMGFMFLRQFQITCHVTRLKDLQRNGVFKLIEIFNIMPNLDVKHHIEEIFEAVVWPKVREITNLCLINPQIMFCYIYVYSYFFCRENMCSKLVHFFSCKIGLIQSPKCCKL